MILLGIVILVHELGHFWAALALGFKIETFSIGFGPRLFGIKIRKTDFRLSAVPLGGYVRIVGHESRGEKATDPRSFHSKPRWQRALVIIAGPLSNMVFAIGMVAGLYMHAFPKQVDTTGPVIASMKQGSPAARAASRTKDFSAVVKGKIGISSAIPVKAVKLRLGPAISQSLRLNGQTALMVFQVLAGIVDRRVSAKSLSGPIGITQMSRAAAQAGAWDYLFFMALVSLQLALFNLFPIPILDGGALLILTIEMLLQREIKLQVKNTISTLGCAFLTIMVVVVIYNDISRLLARS